MSKIKQMRPLGFKLIPWESLEFLLKINKKVKNHILLFSKRWSWTLSDHHNQTKIERALCCFSTGPQLEFTDWLDVRFRRLCSTLIFFIRINIFHPIFEVILNILSFQPQKILEWFLIFTLTREYNVQISFKWTTTRSEPENDS